MEAETVTRIEKEHHKGLLTSLFISEVFIMYGGGYDLKGHGGGLQPKRYGDGYGGEGQ